MFISKSQSTAEKALEYTKKMLRLRLILENFHYMNYYILFGRVHLFALNGISVIFTTGQILLIISINEYDFHLKKKCLIGIKYIIVFGIVNKKTTFFEMHALYSIDILSKTF